MSPGRDSFLYRFLADLGHTARKDWPLKLIAVLLAFSLWIYAVAERSSFVTQKVHLEYETSLSVAPSVGTEHLVDVTFQGPQYLLDRLKGRDLTLAVPMEATQSGLHSKLLDPSMIEEIIEDLHAIEVTRIEPSEVKVYLEPRVTKKLSVRPDLRGFIEQLPAGYYLEEDPEVIPASVTVEGPRSLMEATEVIPTEKIIPRPVAEVQEYTVGLRPGSEYLTLQSTSKVLVRFQLSVVEEKRVITGVPVIVEERGIVAVPSTVSVTLEGPPDVLTQSIGPNSIRIRAPYPTGRRELYREVTPLVTVPDSTTLLEVNPPRVDVGPADFFETAPAPEEADGGALP